MKKNKKLQNEKTKNVQNNALNMKNNKGMETNCNANSQNQSEM